MTVTIADAAARLGRTTACSPRDLLAAGEHLRRYVPQGIAAEVLTTVAEGATVSRAAPQQVAQQLPAVLRWKPLI